MKWDIKELENIVRRSHGDQYAAKIHNPLQSIAWKIEMAHFHAREAEQTLKNAISATPGIDDHDPPSHVNCMAVLFAASPCETGQHLRFASFKSEAHIIASAQALHSVCDIICHVVYWAYRLEVVPNAPVENRLNLHSTLRTLKDLPEYSTTASLIQKVVDAPEFKYLAAYVNTTKHKSLVRSNLNASFVPEDRGGMRIEAFSYKDPIGNQYDFDCKWAYDFLFQENHALLIKICAIGQSLNDQLN